MRLSQTAPILGTAISAFAMPSLNHRQEIQITVDLVQPLMPAPIATALQAITINPLLVPAFGVTKGVPVPGTADCQGEQGRAIPCFCPPNPLDFLQKLDFAVNQNGSSVLGTPIRFNNDINDQSEATLKDRATACVIVLQNFNGSFGVGCPAASAPNFLNQQITGVLQRGTVRDLLVAGVQ
jgi:hypothetical protein